MSVDRPSFHESWYRVAELRPRLRATVQTHRQFFRGQRWHVISDPSNNQFSRIDDAAFHFVALLDGRRTVEDAWSICQELFGDAAPTQGEAIQLLGQLYVGNLILSEIPADARGMFEQHRTRTRREIGGFLKNLLFVRIPLFDPDMLLTRWERLAGFLFGRVGMVLWLVLVVLAAGALIRRADQLAGSVWDVVAPSNLFLLYISFAFIKFLHEMGHGLAAKRIGRLRGKGGEVHATGITLLAFTPVPYVDASCAWSFHSKWDRAFVGIAGIYVDLAVASIAAIVWANSSPGLVHAVAYNIIFVAGVSTLLFNGNPLFRFDGYYVLSDLCEMPNLASRAQQHLRYLCKRYLFGLKRVASPAVAPGEPRWLFCYGVAAAINRVVVMISIILLVSDRFPLIGALLAVAILISWLAVPVLQLARYLAAAPELAMVRTRAWTTSGLITAVILIIAGIIPVPDRASAEGVLEPKRLMTVHAEADGFVESVLPNGVGVDPDGPPVVVMRSDQLELEYTQLLADRELGILRRDQARRQEVALAQSHGRRLAFIDEQIAQVQQRQEDLQIKSPIAGRWISTNAERLPGVFVRGGESIGLVASVNELLVRVVADQSLGPRLSPELGAGATVRIRVRGRPELEFSGHIRSILPAGFNRLPSAALGYRTGGRTAVVNDETGTETVEPFFETHIDFDDPEAVPRLLSSGQTVLVRFDMEPRPIAVQAWRALRQLIQRRFAL